MERIRLLVAKEKRLPDLRRLLTRGLREAPTRAQMRTQMTMLSQKLGIPLQTRRARRAR